MKIKTGVRAGNYIDSAQRAIGWAGAEVANFVNAAGTQAGSLVNQANNAWRSLTRKLI